MKRCPKCGGKKFCATAHVTQDWIVDENGNFIKSLNDCVEVTHFPNDDDIWDCHNCGFSAAGSEFNVKGGRRMKMIVHGNTTVTVHCEIEVDDDDYHNGEITEEEIYEKATMMFGGIAAFVGNGGVDKLIGVYNSNESISADEPVTFDDYQEA